MHILTRCSQVRAQTMHVPKICHAAQRIWQQLQEHGGTCQAERAHLVTAVATSTQLPAARRAQRLVWGFT